MRRTLTAIAAATCLAFMTAPVAATPYLHGVGAQTYTPTKATKVNKAKKKVKKYYASKKVKKYYAKRKRQPVQVSQYETGPTQGLSAPSRFIYGALVCADNVNAALAARGIRGTGTRLAKDFLRWGAPSGPRPGAVAVFNRGRNPRSGHVAIVSRVVGGTVYYWNPAGRRGWVEGPIRRAPIAYRVAGL